MRTVPFLTCMYVNESCIKQNKRYNPNSTVLLYYAQLYPAQDYVHKVLWVTHKVLKLYVYCFM
jgi:hypothetical protein